MKKLTTALLGAALLLSPAAFAQNEQQQLPNSGFEEGWGPCTPWTSVGSKGTNGTTPGNWCISNVIGMKLLGNMQGATTTGEKVSGYNSASAVKVYNAPNSTLKSQTVPGYVTLGTTWSTTVGMGNNKDGGTFGGIDFTCRPDAIEFMYKRERGEGSTSTERATVIAYLWKGTWTQSNVPGELVFSGSPKTVNMENRDRCVLLDYKNYMSSDEVVWTNNSFTPTTDVVTQGGTITKSDDAELIAVAEITLTEVKEDWTLCHADFTYFSSATPEKFNIIIAAGDYFNSDKLEQNNSLTIDDVKLLYYTRENHEGYLNIEMLETQLSTDQISNVIIINKSENTCDFTLPNFSLDLGSGPQLLGDIVVPNVAITEENGVKTYVGSVKGLSLAEGEIIADADVKGTIDADNNVDMVIPVTWSGIPINVTFSTVRKNAPEVPAILLDGAIPEGDNFDATDKKITFPEIKDVEIYYSLKEGSTTTDPANAPAKVPAGYTKYEGNPLPIEVNKQYTLTYIAKDTKTGLESEPKTVSFSTTVGIAAIEAENGTAEYFTLQGVRVAEPTNGIYIRVANGKATKVTVK